MLACACLWLHDPSTTLLLLLPAVLPSVMCAVQCSTVPCGLRAAACLPSGSTRNTLMHIQQQAGGWQQQL